MDIWDLSNPGQHASTIGVKTLKKLFAMMALAALSATISPLAAQIPAPLFDYQFQGTFNDSNGAGPALAVVNSQPADAFVAGGYLFGQGSGLRLDAPLTAGTFNSGNYSIAIRFSFDITTGYRRIMEFKNLGADTGQYVLNDQLNFFNVTNGGSFPPVTTADVVFTRDGATGNYSAYLNGSAISVLGFNDSSGLAIANAVAGLSVFHFFRDDLVAGGEESGGVVRAIRIFDHALTGAEVGNAFVAAVPEPATVGAGVLCLLFVGNSFRRRRAARVH